MSNLLATLLSLVCAQPSGQAANPPVTISVQGRVIDAGGNAVAEATVEIRSDAVRPADQRTDWLDVDDLWVRTKTNEKGEFTIKDAPLPGGGASNRNLHRLLRYVVARAPGHGLAWTRVNLENPQDVVELRLGVEARIRGRITDVNGKPLEGVKARVSQIQRQIEGDRTRFRPDLHGFRSQMGLEAVSDAQGSVAIRGLSRGSVIALRVTDDVHVGQTVFFATTEEALPKLQIEQPTSRGRGEAKEYVVHRNEFVVALQPGCRLSGSVTCATTGRPIAGANLSANSAIGFGFSIKSDDHGRFSRGALAPGFYSYNLFTPLGSEHLKTEGTLELSANVREVQKQFKLERGALVQGKVVDAETGAGVAEVLLAFERATENSKPTYFYGRTGADGSFRIATTPGPGRLFAYGEVAGGYALPPGPPWMHEGHIRDSDLVKDLTTHHERPISELTFKLTKGFGISGQVVNRDGKPVAGARFYLISSSVFRRDLPAVPTSEDGNFSITGLDPSRTHVFVVRNAAVGLANRFAVESANGQSRLEGLKVVLVPCGSIAGRIIDDQGKALQGIAVRPFIATTNERGNRSFSDPFFVEPSKTGPEGRFTLTDLIPDVEYTIQATAEHYTHAWSREVLIKSAEQFRITDIVLTRADQSVSGIVVDPNGKPLPGIRLQATSPKGAVWDPGISPPHTDKDGRFKIDRLPAGSVEVQALSEPDEKGISMANRVAAQTGQTDVRIVMIHGLRSSTPPADLGQPAPGFAVEKWVHAPGNDPRSFEPKHFAGKVLVLVFLDETKPSQRILPALQKLHDSLSKQSLVFLRIYETGDPDELSKQSALPAAVLPKSLTPGFSDAHQRYRVRATPSVHVIDQQGILRGLDVEFLDLEKQVRALLGKP